jgi:hypothetical protein
MNVNTTRRAVLSMAAALAGIAGAGSAKDQLAAATEFKNLAGATSRELPSGIRLHAGEFAEECERSLVLDMEYFAEEMAPDEWMRWQQADVELKREFPQLQERQGYNAYARYEDAVFNFIMAAYWEGTQHGAVYEHLRLSLLAPATRCWDCNGAGYSYASLKLAESDWVTCPTCQGVGMAQAKAHIPS